MDKKSIIRSLNDDFRQGKDVLGRVVLTSGVANLGYDFVHNVMQEVMAYNNFNSDNDPYGEHDFGAFHLDGHCIFFKIDYYDCDLHMQSDDPSDPDLTFRVLTVMLAHEY